MQVIRKNNQLLTYGNQMGTPKQNTVAFEIPVTVMVTEQDVADLLVTAFEGGSNYWIESYRYKNPNRLKELGIRDIDGESYPAYAAYPLKEDGQLIIIVEDDTVKQRTLDRKSIEKGLQLLAHKSPKHFADFMDDNSDATTADVFLQYCLFGEIVYG